MSPANVGPRYCPRGLPGPLPPGERLLWQGAPTVSGVFLRVFHARLVAAWFGLTALVFGATAAHSPLQGMAVALPTLAIGAGALLMLAGFAWLVQRTTVYTITDRRVVLHVGIALPITLNLPFALADGAGLRAFPDGSGDIPLQLRAGERVAYLHLWPHARPWRVSRPEPMLRSVPDAREVAAVLGRAMLAHRERAANLAAREAANEDEAVQPVIALRPRGAGPAGRLAAAG